MKSAFDRLSVQDQNNLWVETSDEPMHIMAVLQVEPEPFLDDRGQLKLGAIRRQVDRRLAGTPRLRQVVLPGSLLTGPPIWADDRGFDIRRHVHAALIPAPGTENELLDVVAAIDEHRLDRSHALWELWVLTGLANNRIAMVFKLHHAIADGLAAIALIASLFDFPSAARADHPSIPAWSPQLPPGRADLIRDNLAGKLAVLRRLVSGSIRPAGVWQAIGRFPRWLQFVVRQSRRAPRTSLNRPIGSRRRIGVVRLSLDDVKAVAHAHGGRVNDLLLTVIAGGLRSLLMHRHESLRGLELMAGVAVSMRHDTRLGNQVGTMIVGLPVHEPDAVRRLGAVIEGTQAAKLEQSPGGGMMIFSALARSGLSRWFDRRQRFLNVLTTNVAGPPVPIAVLGGRVLDIIPVTPIAGNCTLGFGAFSYDGCLAITVVADAEQVCDLNVVLHGMERDWLALSKSVAVAVAP